ncbi:MAG: glyoxalase/bleomycin resistance/extradiol dioxygenase family protein [Candidatus Aenigmarchaeota archaeon]|nr:glyoxalase/bleomycin resistance/extradiol dioxygenase family protein [Candidatus Aenigmarchaeota archaeon]
MVKEIFVNLPVKDINKTKQFFSALGFTFRPEFTDENAGCLILGKGIYAMLLAEKFFKTFIPGKEISDAKRSTEVLNALTLDSKKAVDEMMKKVIEAGGREFRPIEDSGWMYGGAFEDLDGHIWEIFYMDENKMPEAMKIKGRE